MRAISPLICIAFLFAAMPIGIAQDAQPGPPARAPRAVRSAPSAVAQHPGRSISVEVVFADVAGDSEATMTAEKLAELEKAGKVTSLSRLRLSAVENQPSMVQFGERVTVVTGRANFGRGGGQEVLAQENLGTVINVTARVEEDESIVMEFQAEQARLAPAAAKAEGDNAERSADLPRMNTTTTRSTLRIPAGKSVVASGKTTKTADGAVQTWILVSAHAAAGEAKAEAVLKIVTLKHAHAEAIAALLSGINRGEDYRLVVDERTNRLIISGNPSMLEKVIPLVAELDQAAAESAPK